MMSKVESAIIPSVRVTSTWRLAFTWIGASVIAVPLAVLLHELSHLLFNFALGFQGVALHYSSTTYSLERTFWQLMSRGNLAAAAAMIPLWKVSVATVAGIAGTYFVSSVCCVFAARKNPHPLVIALGMFAPVRFLSGLATMRVWLAGKPVWAGTDEAHLTALTVIPLPLLILSGLLFLVLVWIWMVRHIPRGHRWIYSGSLFSGLALGSYLYFSVIGPWLLP